MRASFNAWRGVSTPSLVAAVAIVLTACSSPTASPDTTSSSPRPLPTSAAPTSSASPAAGVKRAALNAYLHMWQAFSKAAKTSDWQSPALVRYATGKALSTLSRGLYADHYSGVVTKGEATHDARVVSVKPPTEPTKVTVVDCSDSSDTHKVDAETGDAVDDEPGGRRRINAIVEKMADGSWKVTDFGVQEVGSC